MASYNSSSFIVPNNDSDVAIRFQNVDGFPKLGVSVGKIQNIVAQGNFLNISLAVGSGRSTYALDFASETEAQQAQVALTTSINNLYPNYTALGGTIALTATPTLIPITLNQYVTLATANSLLRQQRYTIADSLNTFGIGTSYNVQALSPNDFYPEGFSPSLGLTFKLDLVNNKVLSKFDCISKRLSSNNSSITSSDNSSYLAASNSSAIIATNSTYIEASNNSTITAIGCLNVTADMNCNLSVSNATDVSFSSISGDYSDLVLADVAINRFDTKGKVGTSTMTDADQTLSAYIDTINQRTSTISANHIIILTNRFDTCNALIRIAVAPSTMGNYNIQIKDFTSGNILITLSSAYEGTIVHLCWDKVGLAWILDHIEGLAPKKFSLTISNDSQTSISLAYAPLDSLKSELYVNGVKARYGPDYTVSGKILIWNNSEYILETTDLVEFKTI